MKIIIGVIGAAIFLLSSGCSSGMARRTAYESLQNKGQMDCQQHPGSACPEKKSYDDYERSLKNKQSEPGK
jgi:uncharacterized membrane protein